MTDDKKDIAIRHITAASIAAVLILAVLLAGGAGGSGPAGFAATDSASKQTYLPGSSGPGSLVLLAYADEKSDLESKLKEAKQDAKDAKSDYLDKKNEEESIGKKIKALTASIRKTEKELKAVEKDIKENDGKITIIEGDIERLESEVGTQNSELMGRLRMMYTAGDVSVLEVLFSSENIIDFLTNLDMIQRIHAQDVEILDELNRNLELVESKKTELVEVKVMLDEQRRVEKQKKAGLAKDKKELIAAQAKVRAEAKQALDDIEELEAASKSIEAELKKLESRGTYGGGKMGWPANGSISSGFGSRIHPISGSRRMHTGVDIAAPTGAPVYAAADGIVVRASAGWNGGYGNIVIIDHGSGITTLYGHNSSLAVPAGATVKRGDVVAYVGSTGNSTGPHCHFEVRVNGTPQNPMGWL